MSILYLGLEVPEYYKKTVIHYPIIQIVPNDSPEVTKKCNSLGGYTHIIFTSKSSVKIFSKLINHKNVSACFVAVGKATAQCLSEHGFKSDWIAEEETSEGIVKILKKILTKESFVFWPHSKLSRSVLREYFEQNQIKYEECVLYNTISHKPYPLPDLKTIHEIIFTSPSTINAWLELFGPFPKNITLTPIGPITQAYLHQI